MTHTTVHSLGTPLATMWHVFAVSAAVLATAMTPANGLEVVWEKTSYRVTHGKRTLFKSAPIGVFLDGTWAAESTKTLSMTSQGTFAGTDVRV